MKRLVLTLGVIFTSILLLEGCEVKKVGKKRVELFYDFWADARQFVARKSLIKEFEKEYPPIKVKLRPTTGGATTTVYQTRIAAGIAGDVMDMAADWSRPFAEKGALVDLTPFIEKERGILNYYPSKAIAAFRLNGMQYALPMRMFSHVLYFNRDLFDKAGLSYPNQSWSWDNFLEAAKKLTKGEGVDKQFGVIGSDDLWFWTLAFGGRGVDRDKKMCVITREESVKSIKFYRDLIYKYQVSPSPVELVEGMSAGDIFISGRGAMHFASNYRLRQYPSIKSFRWATAPIPKARGARYTIIYFDGLSISTQSKHKEEAWELVKYLSKWLALREHFIPVHKSISKAKIYENLGIDESIGKVFFEALNYGRIKLYSGRWKITTVALEELDLVWLKKKSPQEACEEIKKKVDELLSQGIEY